MECLEPERRLSGNAMEPQKDTSKNTSKNSKLYYGMGVAQATFERKCYGKYIK